MRWPAVATLLRFDEVWNRSLRSRKGREQRVPASTTFRPK